MKTQVLNATGFKAKCLAYLDEIEKSGASITITKRGRQVAVVGPVERRALKSPAGSLAGKSQEVGDIIISLQRD